jgi:mono/diheme cytochrome c family protein
MRHSLVIAIAFALALLCSCSRKPNPKAAAAPTAYGTAIVLSSGDKQTGGVGSILDQPLVVQVNDAQNNGVAGAPVWFSASSGTVFDPAYGITDSNGQVSTTVTVGGMAGRYRLTAYTIDASGKRVDLRCDEIALGYQGTLGRVLNDRYCSRCHDNESTPERVSNFDNLTAKPHPFTDGETLNKLSDEDLTAIISHGGPALNRSAEMPPFGYTLSKNDIQALIAYIRAVSDPLYRYPGIVYAKAN